MWVYPTTKPSAKYRLADYMLEVPFDANYGVANRVRIQRLSIVPRVPQIEGLFIPSPDVNPHMMSLIKLIIFKPMHVNDDLDDRGNQLDPYKRVDERSTQSQNTEEASA